MVGAVVQRKMIDYVFDIFHHQLNSVKSIDLTEFEPVNGVDIGSTRLRRQIKKSYKNVGFFNLAGVVGIEPTSKVLETFILPMNYTPKLCCNSNYVIYIKFY